MVKPKKQSLEDYTADLLIKHEGFRDSVYLDGNGIPTIGYGFTDPMWIKKGRITKSEARQELKRQIKSRQNILRSKLGPEIWDNLQDSSKAALTSYHYNYPAGFKDTTRLMKNWKAGRWYDAIREIDAGMNDENNRGLRTRRLEEQELLMQDPFFQSKFDSELVKQLKQSQWKPQPVLQPVIQQKQDYPIQVEAPQSLNAYNMPESPSYTTRLPDVQQFMNAVMPNQYSPQYDPIQTTNQVQPIQNVILPDGNKTMRFSGYRNGKLPGYKDGYKYSWDNDTQSFDRYTADQMGEVFNDFVVTPNGNRIRFNYEKQPMPRRTPKTESDQEYTKRRIEETTKNSTPIADAMNIGVGFIPGVGDTKDAIAASIAGVKGDYTTASLLGAGLLVPNIAKPLIRKIQKPIKRLFGKYPNYNAAYESFNGRELADQVGSRAGDFLRYRTDKEKATFSQMYIKGIANNEFLSNQVMPKSIKDYMDAGATREEAVRLQKLFLRNPEYAYYLGNSVKGEIDPLSQEAVDGFLKNQFTSLRGVSAPSEESAKVYLTHAEKGRYMSGGDRLDSDGGVYTSNSTNVADRFKNPQSGVEDGYVAKLLYPYNIRRDIPIEDQLEQYRKMIFPASKIHPLYGTDSYFSELNKARSGGAVALESDYVGNATKGIPGQERVYLPKEETGSHPVLNIEQIYHYPNQTNKNGRWGYGMDAGQSDGLFVPRQMNAYSDYIRSAKEFLKPVKDRDIDKYWDAYQKAEATWRSLATRRYDLLDKLRKRRNATKIASYIFGVTSGGILGGHALGSAMQHYGILRDPRFFNDKNQYYNQYLDDPRSDVSLKTYDEDKDEDALKEYYQKWKDDIHEKRKQSRIKLSQNK